MRTLACVVMLSYPVWGLRFGHAPHHSGPHAFSSRSASPEMLLQLPRSEPWGWGPAAQPELIYEGRTKINFLMETIHLTKRRVSGSVTVDAPAQEVWACLTDYERHPEFIPSIVSHSVSRDVRGQVTVEQVSLLSRKMNLRTQMKLLAIEDVEKLELQMRRLSGHGFLEFDGQYSLVPRSDGKTALSYSVELVPCPIFPLPLVERKIRKEVPKMLAAVAATCAARRRE